MFIVVRNTLCVSGDGGVMAVWCGMCVWIETRNRDGAYGDRNGESACGERRGENPG